MAKNRPDKWSLRDLVYLGVFGGIWVLVETTFGSFLHSTRVPEKGSILAGTAAIIMIVARYFIPKKGSTVIIGMATAMLKVLSTGGTVSGGVFGWIGWSVLGAVRAQLGQGQVAAERA